MALLVGHSEGFERLLLGGVEGGPHLGQALRHVLVRHLGVSSRPIPIRAASSFFMLARVADLFACLKWAYAVWGFLKRALRTRAACSAAACSAACSAAACLAAASSLSRRSRTPYTRAASSSLLNTEPQNEAHVGSTSGTVSSAVWSASGSFSSTGVRPSPASVPSGRGASVSTPAAAHDDHGPRFKKPQTAYAHFKQAKRSATRASMKKEEAARIGIGLHAEVSDKDVAERLAEMWTTLDASEKQAFEALAVAAWERHARELADDGAGFWGARESGATERRAGPVARDRAACPRWK